MKFFKLIKSIDYVTYPTYIELCKISNAVNNSFTALRDALISAIIGVIFDATPLSKWVLEYVQNKSFGSAVEKLLNCEDILIIISILIAICFYFTLRTIHFIYNRLANNKNTKNKRDIIVYKFYSVAIPQLIEIKSILEQVDEDDSNEERKIVLLLLQAKHEICELYKMLSDMRIIERKKTGNQTESSVILHTRISRCAYSTFLAEMLDIMLKIYVGLSTCVSPNVEDDIEDIRATINKTGVFDKDDMISDKLKEVKLATAKVK